MNHSIKLFFGFLLIISHFAFSTPMQAENPKVWIQTELGELTLELYVTKAPLSAGNFLKYVKENRFKGALFYRTVTADNQPKNKVKIAVIQGGLFDDNDKKRLPAIKHETTEQTGILHDDGVISWARLAPGTASSEFFICVGAQPELDYKGKRNPDGKGFAAFGKVIKGMDTVLKIHKQPAKGQYLNPKIKITGMKLLQ